jgi:uncharacterized protein YdhG (YjbR/CyaY superfamily)
VKKQPARKTAPGGKSEALPHTVDQYLAGVPEPERNTLQKVRAVIRSAAPPEAIEVISYRIPALKYKQVLVWFAAFSDHCSLFPTNAVIEAFQDELKAYRVSKGTIHFPVDKPLPASLVKRMVKMRVAQVESPSQRKGRK